MKLFYSHQTGRSMIEMLGVLAIIGILSVGAIAGYSKAMFRYKLQKTMDEYVIFFQNVLPYQDQLIALKDWLNTEEGKNKRLAGVLNDMQLLPNHNWVLKGIFIYDSLGNRINPFIRSGQFLNFDLSVKSDSTSVFVCEALYRDVLMQFSDNLHSTSTYQYDSEGEGKGNFSYYGNLYCNGTTKKCIKDLTLTDIRAICSDCKQDDSHCLILMIFN